jgi:hypothetical protein
MTVATMPPLGKVLTADEIARFVARVAYPTSREPNRVVATRRARNQGRCRPRRGRA